MNDFIPDSKMIVQISRQTVNLLHRKNLILMLIFNEINIAEITFTGITEEQIKNYYRCNKYKNDKTKNFSHAIKFRFIKLFW